MTKLGKTEMKILSDFMHFIHKVKAFPRLLFLSGIIVCWFGGALSAYANDGSCHAIYSVSPNGSANLHVPCVVLDSTSDDTVYEFDLNQVSKGEPLSFAIVNRKSSTGAVSGAKATFNEATGVFFLPLVETRNAAGKVEHYAVQMKTVSPSSANLVISSKTLLTSTANNPSLRKKADKVAVCHIPPGNPAAAHTINISMNGYENGHKKHGDTLGACGSSSSDDQGGTGDGDTGTDGSDNTGGDGTGGDGIVTAYSISGYVRDIKDKSNISLNTISSEISTSKTDKDGKYVFNLSEAEYQSILDNGFAYVKVGNEILRGLILGVNKFSNSYSGSDTDISYYSEALFRIKDALGLDLNATKVLYKDFLQSYNNGIYELNDYSYSFAFRDIIEELAENIRENLSNNTPLISHDEIIGEIKLLNHLEVSNFHKATKYSFPLLITENDTIVLTITSFKNHVATDDFTANMEVIVKNDSPFYDNAFLTKINFSDASVVLKDVNVKTFVVDINKQVLFNDEDVPIIMRGRENKHLTYGETDNGRFLFVVWVSKYRKTRIVTARDMTRKEKQFYRKRKK